jgi:hypothetical protein
MAANWWRGGAVRRRGCYLNRGWLAGSGRGWRGWAARGGGQTRGESESEPEGRGRMGIVAGLHMTGHGVGRFIMKRFYCHGKGFCGNN